jgi:hypothetical protein
MAVPSDREVPSPGEGSRDRLRLSRVDAAPAIHGERVIADEGRIGIDMFVKDNLP